jgi:hypothetical protein
VRVRLRASGSAKSLWARRHHPKPPYAHCYPCFANPFFVFPFPHLPVQVGNVLQYPCELSPKWTTLCIDLVEILQRCKKSGFKCLKAVQVRQSLTHLTSLCR